jgi:hypothetical protein
MLYPTLTIDQGKSVLEGLRSGAHATAASPKWLGNGPQFDVTLVDDLVDRVTELRRVRGEPDEGGKRYWAEFEGLAAASVHEALDALPVTVAVDPGFWIWLVFGSGHDGLAKLVSWRHGRGRQYDARDDNFGLTTALEAGFWSRLWLRGDIAYDTTRPDPYELAERGDQDLWRSHIMRQEYAHARQVARALLTFQYPDETPTTPRVAVKVIRAMAKELRRRHATMAYELLDEAAARQLIEDVHASVTAR